MLWTSQQPLYQAKSRYAPGPYKSNLPTRTRALQPVPQPAEHDQHPPPPYSHQISTAPPPYPLTPVPSSLQAASPPTYHTPQPSPSIPPLQTHGAITGVIASYTAKTRRRLSFFGRTLHQAED